MRLPIGGQWVGWTCAYSTLGELLALPPDLCRSDSPTPVGFKECTSERVYPLHTPATGTFVERETAKLIPDSERVQHKAGCLSQIHDISSTIIQDSHYEDDIWVLQTVWPAVKDGTRWRLALMFNASAGKLVRGMRVWSEQRCVHSLPALAECSSGALATAWEQCQGCPSSCFGDLAVDSPSGLGDAADRVQLPVAGGLTIRTAKRRLLIAAGGTFVQRRFLGGQACWARSRTSKSRVTAIRASLSEPRQAEDAGRGVLSLVRSKWPQPTVAQQSFRLIGGPYAEQSASLIDALSNPAISVVVLQRSRLQQPYESWPEVADISSRVRLSDALSNEQKLSDMLARAFPCASEASQAEMSSLIRLFAQAAREAGGAGPETWLHCRLMATSGPGKCPRLHYDKVALRLTVALCGDGTLWLPDAAINRFGLAKMLRPELLPQWLQGMLLQPWGWYLFNLLVRQPLASEQRTSEGDALLMKGSRWRFGLPRSADMSGQRMRRALPAMHRSPLDSELKRRHDDSGTARRVRRVLFTVDFS